SINVVPLPDLSVTSVTAPATAGAGATIVVSNTVANGTTSAAGSFRVGIYLSADNICTTSDTLIGSRTVASLAGGASSTDATSVVLPAHAALGAATVCVIADDLSQVAEHLETNNTGSAPITILAALPTLTLKVNGQHPSPPVVTTNGPMTLTLDISASAYTA